MKRYTGVLARMWKLRGIIIIQRKMSVLFRQRGYQTLIREVFRNYKMETGFFKIKSVGDCERNLLNKKWLTENALRRSVSLCVIG